MKRGGDGTRWARRKSRFWLVLVPSLILSDPASAETIFGALSKAYVNNSTLDSARAGVRVTDETVPLAKSGYRPVIAGSSRWNYANGSGVSLTTGSFGVEIGQTLFDGLQTRNSVRAAEARVRDKWFGLRTPDGGSDFGNTGRSIVLVSRGGRLAP